MAETSLQTVNSGSNPPATTETRSWTVSPRIDIVETDDEVRLYADMPGVKPEDVDIRFENGELSVHGRRTVVHHDKSRTAWENPIQGYYRTFRLTEQIASDRIQAELKNGVLTLHLPKIEAVKPRRITVRG
jgi:HSP20 family protein